jgi:hypothetical protein
MKSKWTKKMEKKYVWVNECQNVVIDGVAQEIMKVIRPDFGQEKENQAAAAAEEAERLRLE